MPPDVAGLPWPEGDPGGLRSASSRLARAASGLRATGSRFGGAARSAPSWNGVAATAYAGGVAEYTSVLAGAASSLSGAAGALTELAAEVEDAQQEVRELARKVEAAEQAAREARERANALAAVAAAAQAAAVTADVTGFDPQAVVLGAAADDARASAGSAEAVAADLEGEAADVRRRAEQRARDLCQQVEAADRATAGELRAATVAAPAGGIGHPASGLPSSALGRVLAPTYAPVYRHDDGEDHLPADYRRSIAGLDPLRDGDTTIWPLSDRESLRDGDLDNATLPYVFTTDAHGNLEIEYWRWHHYNDFPGPRVEVFGVGTTVGDGGAGSHDGDWEKFAVGFDDRGAPSHSAFASHEGGHDTPWVDVETDGGHPVVYVAHGGHGSYPEAGSFDNPATGIDDQADGTGEEWDTSDDLVDGSTDVRLHDRAQWGDDSSAVVDPPQSPRRPAARALRLEPVAQPRRGLPDLRDDERAEAPGDDAAQHRDEVRAEPRRLGDALDRRVRLHRQRLRGRHLLLQDRERDAELGGHPSPRRYDGEREVVRARLRVVGVGGADAPRDRAEPQRPGRAQVPRVVRERVLHSLGVVEAQPRLEWREPIAPPHQRAYRHGLALRDVDRVEQRLSRTDRVAVLPGCKDGRSAERGRAVGRLLSGRRRREREQRDRREERAPHAATTRRIVHTREAPIIAPTATAITVNTIHPVSEGSTGRGSESGSPSTASSICSGKRPARPGASDSDTRTR
ncbi:MAG TPA: Vps62-related protein [Actinomycetota bacterium]|nr:Vps62-related protein [Actinomycetota bacterium]